MQDSSEVVHDHVTGPNHEPVNQHQVSAPEILHEVGQGEEQAGLQAEEEDLRHNQQYNHKCQECGELCIFADDSTYIVSNRTEQSIKLKHQPIAEYMSRKRLILNNDKTHWIV